MSTSESVIEILTADELAQRLKVRTSWVVEQSKRSRTSDPLPVFRVGKHRRYRWNGSEMNAWLERRVGNNHLSATIRKAGSSSTAKGGYK